MNRREFQCYKCKQYFDEDSEKEAQQELKANFGKLWKPEDCEVFCDSCYNKFMENFKKRTYFGICEELNKAVGNLFNAIVKAFRIDKLYEFLKRKKLVWLIFVPKGLLIIGIFILFLLTIFSL